MKLKQHGHLPALLAPMYTGDTGNNYCLVIKHSRMCGKLEFPKMLSGENEK